MHAAFHGPVRRPAPGHGLWQRPRAMAESKQLGQEGTASISLSGMGVLRPFGGVGQGGREGDASAANLGSGLRVSQTLGEFREEAYRSNSP